jgi:hypothetical protein
MYFCPNCNNVFDITRNLSQSGGEPSDSQHGGNDNIINKLLNNEPLSSDDLESITLDDLAKSSGYKKLKNKQREYVYNKFNDSLPLEKKKSLGTAPDKIITKDLFVCNNCGFKKKIEPETLIFNRVSSDVAQSYTASDIKDMGHSDILNRTRKYKCPNSKCESHTDPQKREAVYFRLNNTFKIKYICQTCHVSF